MEYRKHILAALTVLLVLALGCIPSLSGRRTQGNQRELTLSDFDFLERDTTPGEIVNRLGWPDRFVGSGLVAYQYDLADGRIVELSFFGGQLYAQVQEEDGTWTDLDLSERPGWLAMRRIGKWTILALVVLLGIGWWIGKQCRKCNRGK